MLNDRKSSIYKKCSEEHAPDCGTSCACCDGCAGEGENGDIRRKAAKIIVSAAILCAAVFMPLPPETRVALYLLAYLLAGSDVLFGAVKNIFAGRVFDENFLMSIATVGAFAIAEFSEAVAIMLFFKTGEIFQQLALGRSKRSIRSLMDIKPGRATVLKDGEVLSIAPEEVRVGDIVIVSAGERIPVDGKVIRGSSSVDASSMTGESIPVQVSEGSEVLSGCINQTGLIHIEALKEYGESAAARILKLIEHASEKKAPAEHFITKFARIYTPIVVGCALAVAFLPPLLLGSATLSQWVYRALVFLVISCPCALVISIPLTIFAGIGASSRNGILVKGGNYLEALRDVETVVFDKTGTLTEAGFAIKRTVPVGDVTAQELLRLAATAEQSSGHPIAKAIVKACQSGTDAVLEFEETPGRGVRAKTQKHCIDAGNEEFLKGKGAIMPRELCQETAVHVAVDGTYIGFIELEAPVKPDAGRAIGQLKGLGVKRVIMLTGDSRKTALKVSKGLDIDSFYARLLPDEKVEIIERLEAEKGPKGRVLFAGDGINDAPVLARADIGVAMGGIGSDAAIEAADIVLMTDEPSKIAGAIVIARRTMAILRQNIALAIGIKLAILALGAFGMVSMWLAVFADVGVALIVIVNSVRALKIKV